MKQAPSLFYPRQIWAQNLKKFSHISTEGSKKLNNHLLFCAANSKYTHKHAHSHIFKVAKKGNHHFEGKRSKGTFRFERRNHCWKKEKLSISFFPFNKRNGETWSSWRFGEKQKAKGRIRSNSNSKRRIIRTLKDIKRVLVNAAL